MFPAFATVNFTRACHPLHVFPRLPPVIGFPALVTSYTFSGAFHTFALVTCYTLSYACHPLHVILHLPPVTCFSALAARWSSTKKQEKELTKVCHPLHVFPRLLSFTCFPAIATRYLFSRDCHPLHVFPRLPPVSRTVTEAFYINFRLVCCTICCYSDLRCNNFGLLVQHPSQCILPISLSVLP